MKVWIVWFEKEDTYERCDSEAQAHQVAGDAVANLGRFSVSIVEFACERDFKWFVGEAA